MVLVGEDAVDGAPPVAGGSEVAGQAGLVVSASQQNDGSVSPQTSVDMQNLAKKGNPSYIR